MRPTRSRLELGALLSAGVFGVHQGRYLLAYGGHTEHELQAQGHAYLTALEPLIGLALAFSIGGLLFRALAGKSSRRVMSRRQVWLTLTAVLLSVYTGQEWLEGHLAAGHASGLAGVFGGGGWLAVPLAVVAGGAMTLLVRGADRVAETIAAFVTSAGRVRVAAPPATPSCVTAWNFAAPSAPLSRHLAGRGPPPSLSN